jgi:uncharacterized membrane protein
MVLLILGVLLWAVTHSMRHTTPAIRARLGEQKAKGVVAGVSLLAIVLMVIGYRSAGWVPLYDLGPDAVYLNNLLMVIAVALVMSPTSGSRIRNMLRHPMLTGLVLWAVAHLLIAGDLAALILFGGLSIWALTTIALINQADPYWTPPDGTLKGDLILLGLTIAIVAAAAGIHIWLGLAPLGVTSG